MPIAVMGNLHFTVFKISELCLNFSSICIIIRTDNSIEPSCLGSTLTPQPDVGNLKRVLLSFFASVFDIFVASGSDSNGISLYSSCSLYFCRDSSSSGAVVRRVASEADTKGCAAGGGSVTFTFCVELSVRIELVNKHDGLPNILIFLDNKKTLNISYLLAAQKAID
ncbi:hypothetical protein FF38_06361 [Lucilia cuprina]|uniref:Uncharacterized protein n=1 Tax=Lucilia cuprina TaxID=7375 RepID=A0A0L0C3G4_LUCCU|nr:hypothetical protein FF38_06361 [Lucilia cuprina]